MEKTWLQRFAQGAEGGTEGTASAQGEQQTEQPEQHTEQPEQSGQPERLPEEENPLVRRHWQRVDDIYSGWMEQAEAMKQLFPDFDIRQELADGRFGRMLLDGIDGQTAREKSNLHIGQILPAAMEYAARTVEARLAEAIRSGTCRPGENGLGGGAAALVGRNVTQMTRQDYDRYCRMVERGERGSFG